MSSIARPALPHQVLLNLSGFLTASFVECDRVPLALTLMAEVLPLCPPEDATDPMLRRMDRAAWAVLALADQRHNPARALEWAAAVQSLRGAVAEILWARACMAHAVLHPVAPADDPPATPNPSEPVDA